MGDMSVRFVTQAVYKDTKRVQYTAVDDKAALDAFARLTETEGIMPALESAHAVAEAIRIAPKMTSDKKIVVCLSGRGDKDIHTVAEHMEVNLYE